MRGWKSSRLSNPPLCEGALRLSGYTIPIREESLLSRHETIERGGVLMADVVVDADDLLALATEILSLIGCDEDVATVIAEHLVGSDLRGVHSHGTMRLTQ